MKYFFIFFTILIWWLSISPAQTVWKNKYYDVNGVDFNITFTNNQAVFTTPGDFYSTPFTLGSSKGGHSGLWGVVTKIDSIVVAGAAQPDTIDFYPEYWRGQTIGWVTGAKMVHHQRADTTGTSAFVDSISQFIDNVQHGTVYYWQTAPYDTFSVHSFPNYEQRVRIKMVLTRAQGTVNVGIKQELFFDTY